MYVKIFSMTLNAHHIKSLVPHYNFENIPMIRCLNLSLMVLLNYFNKNRKNCVKTILNLMNYKSSIFVQVSAF